MRQRTTIVFTWILRGGSRGSLFRLALLCLVVYSLVQIQLHSALVDNDDNKTRATTGIVGVSPEAERPRVLSLAQQQQTGARSIIEQQDRERQVRARREQHPTANMQLVETSTWASPSVEYRIDPNDLWEDRTRQQVQFPTWMVQYFRWHKEQTDGEHSASNSNNYNQQRYLYVTCLAEYRKCGGAADRLLSLPFLVRVAAASRRILLIQWTKPAALEEFLLPPLHGIDWRVAQGKDIVLQKRAQLAGNQDSILDMAAKSDIDVLQVKFQSHDHGAVYYDDSLLETNEADFATIFHAVWRIFFTPAPPLVAQIERTMQASGLVPGHYGAAHVRALYGVQDRDETFVTGWTENAVRCAAHLLQQQSRVDGPVYFASDSELAVQIAIQYGEANGLRVTSRPPVTGSTTNLNPLHLDKTKDWRQRPASDFYDVFIDLYLLGFSRCMTYGMGGYGQFASLIFPTGNTHCSMIHMNATAIANCQMPEKSILEQQVLTTKDMQTDNNHLQPIFLQPMRPNRKVDTASVEQTEMTPNESVNRSEGEAPPPFPNMNDLQTTAIWEQSKVIPQWMNEYFTWHGEQRKLVKEDNWRDFRYLVMVCFRDESSLGKCGGTADRLRPVPFMVRVAAETKRILFIHWERPAPLESFLMPPEGGLDWRTPGWLVPKLRIEGQPAASVDSMLSFAWNDDCAIINAHVQAHDHGSNWYNRRAEELGEGSDSFRIHYHDCWYSIFTPVPAIANRIEVEMQRMDLVPGEYAFAHVRATYGIEDAGRDPVEVKSWTENALNCLSGLRPGGPYFVSSDSSYAKEVAIAYGKERGVSVVARMDGNEEPLHLDLASKQGTRDPTEYFPVFVDLYLMSMGRCYAYNVGGFGKWASMLSQDYTSRRCNVRYWTKGVNKKSADIDGCKWTDATPNDHKRAAATKKQDLPLFLPPMRNG